MDKLRNAISLSATGAAKETEKGTFVKSYLFEPDFIGFSGHFPGHPVLPAFVQVLTALTMAEEIRGHAIKLVTIIKAKFRIEIQPGREIEVRYRDRMIKGETGLEATLTVAEGLAATFLLTFIDTEQKGEVIKNHA
jgi:3-hydroxyacyl-[acyl-carrier-protein] dehydratase